LLLGFFWPGLGHLYAGAPLRGVGAVAALFVVVIPAVVLARVLLDFSETSVIIGVVVAIALFLLVPLDGALTARRRRGHPPTRWNRVWIYVAYAVLYSVLSGPLIKWELDHFWFRTFKIPSGAMMDTLLIGDMVIADMRKSKLFPLRRGQIIVFRHPEKLDVAYIKRAIGLPGETVELRDGFLYVDGRRVDEPYVQPDFRQQDPHRNFGPLVVQQDHYFVLGDHRNQSSDSRFWGQVPQALVEGRARSIWWSYDEGSAEGLSAWAANLFRIITRVRWERLGRSLDVGEPRFSNQAGFKALADGVDA
jgi:signal peptidase I